MGAIAPGMARMIEPVARIRIELRDLEPKIWRRVDVPLSSTLEALHHIIQASFHWQDYHSYEFVVGDRVYGVPTDDDILSDRKTYKASALRLKTLVERAVNRFLYVYDFGDDWRHDVIVEEVRDGDEDTEYPAFVDGARRCPPEDVGGTDGFMEFLEAVLDATHEEHTRMMEWCGGAFDPEDIDEQQIRQVLGIYAGRRRGPLSSHRSGRRRESGKD